jgi:putative transposase
VVKTGCQWDWLPHDFPPKGTVYHYVNTQRKNGVWKRMNPVLREQVLEFFVVLVCLTVGCC